MIQKAKKQSLPNGKKKFPAKTLSAASENNKDSPINPKSQTQQKEKC